MASAREVVILELDEAAVIAALLGRDARARRRRLVDTTARTREVGLAAIAALEAGARAWSDQAARARNGHSDVRDAPGASTSARDDDDECTIAEAARITGLCQRQLRRLAPQLGHKDGGRWALARADVLAFADEREGRPA